MISMSVSLIYIQQGSLGRCDLLRTLQGSGLANRMVEERLSAFEVEKLDCVE